MIFQITNHYANHVIPKKELNQPIIETKTMKEEINSYKLSRDWFDFCFENPDIVRPIHSAIYFFAIEHCNRLGWKDKFGFPSQMAMEAIGVKNWRTYSSALNELVDFGFIKMIQISKNQYSSNIIAIVKNTKASTKALDKALSKHSTKHSQSTVSIDKQEETINNEQLNNAWRKNFDIYKSELLDWFENIKTDYEYLAEQEKFNPGIDVVLSIEKSIKVFWGTEAGWKNKKSSKTVNIDWRQTIAKNLDKNKVYKNQYEINRTNTKRGFNSPETGAAIESVKRQFAEVEQARIDTETLSGSH